MRRGQTACIFDSCDNMYDLLSWFIQFLDILKIKVDREVDEGDPTLMEAKKSVASNREICVKGLEKVGPPA